MSDKKIGVVERLERELLRASSWGANNPIVDEKSVIIFSTREAEIERIKKLDLVARRLGKHLAEYEPIVSLSLHILEGLMYHNLTCHDMEKRKLAREAMIEVVSRFSEFIADLRKPELSPLKESLDDLDRRLKSNISIFP